MKIIDKLNEIVKDTPYTFKVSDSEKLKKDFTLEIYIPKYDKFFDFAKISGNYARNHLKNFVEVYDVIKNQSTTNFYDLILSEYKKNNDFYIKYVGKKKIRKANFSIEEGDFFYKKKNNELLILPTLRVVNQNTMVTVNFTASEINNPQKAIDKLNKTFYDFSFSGFLEKPLNEYSVEELILIEIIEY